ncbi:hypothetical protein EV359DRAFT_86973 [Lentinula novae-zelandiae]|nr:hypothetical protein EV359DRAFT_86973 [Lentinula novae-zelandiae]
MLFLTTLLPLITLALRVTAADLEQGIPLGSVPHPANVYLPSHPQTHKEPPEASIPTVDYGSNVQQSVSPRCLEEVFVGGLAEAKDRLQDYVKGVMPKCIFATFAAGFLVVLNSRMLNK